jgi:hypothetical protein
VHANNRHHSSTSVAIARLCALIVVNPHCGRLSAAGELIFVKAVRRQ